MQRPIEPTTNLSEGPRAIALEVYRQKYENFRHFDRLRWQAPSLGFASGSALIAFARDKEGIPHWWAFEIFGIVAVLSFWTMYRLRSQLDDNRDALERAATLLGDNSIPRTKTRWGAAWLFGLFMLLLGIVAIAFGVFRLSGG